MANNTNWLNISSQSGSSGQTILTLSANRNLSTDYKTAEITAYNPVYNISAKTYVTIEAYSPYIELSPTLIPVADSGGTFELSISANCSWVIAYPDLVSSYSTTAGTGDRTITFSVSSTTADTTLVGNIVVTDESGQVSRTARIEQYGSGAHIGIFPVELYFDSTGGSATFSVSADCAYEVSLGSGTDWATVTPNSGYTGQTTFTVSVTGSNTGDTVKTGSVLVTGPGTGGLVALYQRKPETRLIVGYYVTSTTNPTTILNGNALTNVSTAEYPDGTQITPASAYTFPSTGMQYVYYTLTGSVIPFGFLAATGDYSGLSDTVRTVYVPEGITRMTASFQDDSSLSSITLPSTLTYIGSSSFSGCTSLSSITLPDGLERIGPYVFSGCTSLSSITIPSGVTEIGADCFTASSVSSITFNSLTPPTLGNANALSSSTLSEIIVPCPAVNNYITAWPQYAQYISCSETGTTLYFVTDTSNVAGTGETRTITILNTNINPNRTGLNLPSDFPQQGSYTVVGNTIYLTYPANPSSSATRNWTIGVVAQTNDGVSLSGSYQITQNAYNVVQIPYTADTSTVDASGETRTITIDTSNLVASSITIGIEGATGISYTYNNGVITITFPENTGGTKWITVNVSGTTLNGENAVAVIYYMQSRGSAAVGDYLTFNIIEGGKIAWYHNDSANTFEKTIQYSLNDGEWTNITSLYEGQFGPAPVGGISVEAGDVVKFRGDNSTYCDDLPYRCSSFRYSTAIFNIEGNIMSLISSTNFQTLTSLQGSFGPLFSGTKVLSANNLVLPATSFATPTYRDGAYAGMFSGCTSLTAAPELPATSLANYCYTSMFAGCTSLTTAPSLPATALAECCYQSMFSGCTSLTAAPTLPATALADYCYFIMFQGCTSLTTVPSLPGRIFKTYCYYGMFSDCTSLTAAPSIAADSITSGAVMCCSYMFSGCTSMVTPPYALYPVILPEYEDPTGSETGCYEGMFMNCTSLNNLPILGATALTTNCYKKMFQSCYSLTGAPANYLPVTNLATGCYEKMFASCSGLTTAPELPAITPKNWCYRDMFNQCSSLTYIKCMLGDFAAYNVTKDWVAAVSPIGTFVKNPDNTYWTTGGSGTPYGWTVQDAT